ncbi:MAG TPA: fluoride efflux transporter CrcB [Thermomicrobiales bacterium]|nr:fluoride efflux transporter CrcB [Thermomicrobiales bacterium]
MTLLLIAVGGALGTVGRYGVSLWVTQRIGPGPLGIFIVNVTGAFLIGFVLVATETRFPLSLDTRRFIAVGLLGGYTTFSTLMFETMMLIEAGSYTRAVANSLGSIAVGLVAVALGIALARAL